MIQLSPRPRSGIRSGQRRTWLAAIQTPKPKGSTMSKTQKRFVLATIETLVEFLPNGDTVAVIAVVLAAAGLGRNDTPGTASR
jgi:hypothetical protein